MSGNNSPDIEKGATGFPRLRLNWMSRLPPLVDRLWLASPAMDQTKREAATLTSGSQDYFMGLNFLDIFPMYFANAIIARKYGVWVVDYNLLSVEF